jgi:hypothetical protein
MKFVQPVLAAVIEEKEGVATLKGLEGVFENVITAILGLAGILLFIMLIFGGIRFMSAGGDPKAVESAKKTLTSAIAGLILIAVSYLILVLIKQITGVNVTQFKIFQQ